MPVLQMQSLAGWASNYTIDLRRKVLTTGASVIYLEDGDVTIDSAIHRLNDGASVNYYVTRIRSGIGDRIVFSPTDDPPHGFISFAPPKPTPPDAKEEVMAQAKAMAEDAPFDPSNVDGALYLEAYMGQPKHIAGLPGCWALSGTSALKYGNSIGLYWNGNFQMWNSEDEFLWRWIYMQLKSDALDIEALRAEAVRYGQDTLLQFLSTTPEEVDFFTEEPSPDGAVETKHSTSVMVRFATLEVESEGVSRTKQVANILSSVA